MKKHRILRALISISIGFVLTILTSYNSAHAYSWTLCHIWPNTYNVTWRYNPTMNINTTSFVPWSSWDLRLQNAMSHWTNVNGSYFQFYVGRDTDGTYSSSNGVSEVYFAYDLGAGSGVLALTKKSWDCFWRGEYRHFYTETDIDFNLNYSWSTSSYDYNNPSGLGYNFEGVALHEFGHALGLGHSDGGSATMNSIYPFSGPIGYNREWDPFADDRQGVRFLYPDSTTEIDIAASPLKYSGAGQSTLVSNPINASRGSYVTIEFTTSNMSTSYVSYKTGFYLSTDEVINTNDILLGWIGVWQYPGNTLTASSQQLYIPTWISPGYYYLGFYLDYDSQIYEPSKEYNNYQQIPRSIYIY